MPPQKKNDAVKNHRHLLRRVAIYIYIYIYIYMCDNLFKKKFFFLKYIYFFVNLFFIIVIHGQKKMKSSLKKKKLGNTRSLSDKRVRFLGPDQDPNTITPMRIRLLQSSLRTRRQLEQMLGRKLFRFALTITKTEVEAFVDIEKTRLAGHRSDKRLVILERVLRKVVSDGT